MPPNQVKNTTKLSSNSAQLPGGNSGGACGNVFESFPKTASAIKAIAASGLGSDVLRMLDAEIAPEILRQAARLYRPNNQDGAPHRSRDFGGRFKMSVK